MATIQDIWSTLGNDEHRPYVLLDVAGLERGYDQLPKAAFATIECLFTGDLGDELRDVAPYLARITSRDNAVRDALGALMAEKVATLVELTQPGEVTFAQLHRHFRKHNLVYNIEGDPRFFRYHDPRLLIGTLAAFDAAQRANFFGPVSRFTLHTDDQGFVRCHCQGEEFAVSA